MMMLTEIEAGQVWGKPGAANRVIVETATGLVAVVYLEPEAGAIPAAELESQGWRYANRDVHCWYGKYDDLGPEDPEWIEQFNEDGIRETCMLPHGHSGPHVYTPDSMIGISFRGSQDAT